MLLLLAVGVWGQAQRAAAVVRPEATLSTISGVRTHGAMKSNQNTIGWLLTCAVSHSLPDDPIVHPGVPGAAHLHDFWGNASTNAMSTYASQEALSNAAVADTYSGATTRAGSSCDLSATAPGTSGDTASYWAPALYADGARVTPDKAQLYYRAKPTFGTDFQPIPTDARLIVGSHVATSVASNPGLTGGHIYWECKGDTGRHFLLPPSSCTHFLVNIVYPSCYSGGRIDHTGPIHTDNERFAYAVNGQCPAGFGIKVPQLSEKFSYQVRSTGMLIQLSADPGRSMPGMVMAGGLSPAYTIHADFWNTWQPNALKYLVDKCINAQISCGTNPVTPVGGVVLSGIVPSPVDSTTGTTGTTTVSTTTVSTTTTTTTTDPTTTDPTTTDPTTTDPTTTDPTTTDPTTTDPTTTDPSASDPTTTVTAPSVPPSTGGSAVSGGSKIKPPAPVRLSATATAGAVALTWTATATGIDYYVVFRDGQAIGDSTGTSFTDPAVSPGRHVYRVKAVNGSGAMSGASKAFVASV